MCITDLGAVFDCKLIGMLDILLLLLYYSTAQLQGKTRMARSREWPREFPHEWFTYSTALVKFI